MTSDNFFQTSSNVGLTIDFCVLDSDTVVMGGRMIKRRKNTVYE